MKLGSRLIAAVALALAQMAAAAELPDCQLAKKGLLPFASLASHRTQDQSRHFLEVEGPLRNGTENIYQRDEPVLNIDMRVVRTVAVLTPMQDFQVKNSWALSPNFSFRKGRNYRVGRTIEVADGRKFAALELVDGTLFVNEEGQLCNKTWGRDVWHAGTLSIEPDGATMERSLLDEPVRSGSLRVIYLGTAAGTMKFQEIWVQGARIGKSITRDFDQFAKMVEIAGFQFEVVSAKGDTLRLRYDIPSRVEIGPERLSQVALQNVGR
jgi:hypothetical protein